MYDSYENCQGEDQQHVINNGNNGADYIYVFYSKEVR